LPAYADAAPAMRKLAAGGVRMACLTNGSADVTQRFLDRNGLATHIERVVSCDEIGSWKPPATVYLHAAQTRGLPRARLALVATHAWDCHGAKRAGLMAGWASRLEGHYGEIFERPDVTGSDLVEVADRLLELPGR